MSVLCHLARTTTLYVRARWQLSRIVPAGRTDAVRWHYCSFLFPTRESIYPDGQVPWPSGWAFVTRCKSDPSSAAPAPDAHLPQEAPPLENRRFIVSRSPPNAIAARPVFPQELSNRCCPFIARSFHSGRPRTTAATRFLPPLHRLIRQYDWPTRVRARLADPLTLSRSR
jgi:hypothetical protein